MYELGLAKMAVFACEVPLDRIEGVGVVLANRLMGL